MRSQALLRTAYLLCGGDKGAAEDILQDVLMSMYGKWRRIEISPEAYARKALANTAAGHEQQVMDADSVVRALAQLPNRMRAVLVLRFFDDPSEADTARTLGCGVGTVKSQTWTCGRDSWGTS